MTDKDLRLYLVYKRKADDLERRIRSLKDMRVITCDKVKSSMPEFPYIEVMTTVTGSDSFAVDQIKGERQELLRVWTSERTKALKAMAKIDKFIQGLPEDNDIRNIFRWTYYDGLKQQEIADRLIVDRSTVSKRINKYLA